MQKIPQDIFIGKNMRRLRKLNNYSQENIALKLQLKGRSMSVSHYGHIEQGGKNIFVSDLILLSEIFKADFNEFFKDLKPSDNKLE
ncbi:helix-turn-helix domain-containing protein [Anaerotignum faecicola]|nr:helix-turn-helix domain-containing protein [Anaerotignum faecicola]